MNRRVYLVSLLVGPLGLGSAAVSAAGGLAVGLRLGPAFGAIAGAIILTALIAALTISGIGARAAQAELDRQGWAKARPYLSAARDARNRLASLRLPDAEIKAMLELLATRGASYLSACEAARSRNPAAEAALAEGLELADLYLKELDGQSTEKRFGLPDAEPFADARERVRAALADKAAVIEKATLDLNGGLPPADAMAVKESI